MRVVGGMGASIGAETTTLARLWRITRNDGTEFRFTDAVNPITFQGDEYRADISFTSSAIFTSTSAANFQSVTMTVIMDDDGLSEVDIRSRLFDSALSEVFIVDYEHPERGGLLMFSGSFGAITVTDKRRATIDVIPAGAQASGNSITAEVYSRTCRANLGDARCKVDLTPRAVSFTVSGVESASKFTAAALTQEQSRWALGSIRWLTGLNKGTRQTVSSSDPSSLTMILVSSPLNPILVGDTGIVYPGCDKQPKTCRDKFNNIANMRAEPFIPDGSGEPDKSYFYTGGLPYSGNPLNP